MGAGYEFVPFPDEVRRLRRDEAVWHKRLENTVAGMIRVTLRTEQAVHIGNGLKRMHDGKVLRSAVRIQDGPGLPASSLKGTLRSRYEAITKSCVQQPPKRTGKVRSTSHEHITEARLTEEALDEAVFPRRRCDKDTNCPACALFGCMSLRSRVTVRDFACPASVAFTYEAIDEQFGPNLHHVGKAKPKPDSRHGSRKEHFEVRQLHGRKFAVGMGPTAGKGQQWIVVIPGGSIITGVIGLFNVLPVEVGGLLAALGHLPASRLKIGGGKGRGFGRVRLTSLHYELRDHLGRAVEVKQATENDWRDRFKASDDRWETGETRLCEIHQGDC